ncbi:hypothetical protein RA269_28755, partial [Pseudomonas syringae pv. tagetis]
LGLGVVLLDGFACLLGGGFLGLRAIQESFWLVGVEWCAAASLAFGELTVIPQRAVEKLRWRLEEHERVKVILTKNTKPTAV